jgi:hypothetical protein
LDPDSKWCHQGLEEAKTMMRARPELVKQLMKHFAAFLKSANKECNRHVGRYV